MRSLNGHTRVDLGQKKKAAIQARTIFIQGRALPRTVHVTLAVQKILYLGKGQWPENSPGMNPIEKALSIM